MRNRPQNIRAGVSPGHAPDDDRRAVICSGGGAGPGSIWRAQSVNNQDTKSRDHLAALKFAGASYVRQAHTQSCLHCTESCASRIDPYGKSRLKSQTGLHAESVSPRRIHRTRRCSRRRDRGGLSPCRARARPRYGLWRGDWRARGSAKVLTLIGKRSRTLGLPKVQSSPRSGDPGRLLS